MQFLHFLIFSGRLLKGVVLLSWHVNSCNPSLPFRRERSQDVHINFFIIIITKSSRFPVEHNAHPFNNPSKLHGITTVQFQEGAVGSVRVSLPRRG